MRLRVLWNDDKCWPFSCWKLALHNDTQVFIICSLLLTLVDLHPHRCSSLKKSNTINEFSNLEIGLIMTIGGWIWTGRVTLQDDDGLLRSLHLFHSGKELYLTTYNLNWNTKVASNIWYMAVMKVEGEKVAIVSVRKSVWSKDNPAITIIDWAEIPISLINLG